MAKFTFTGLDSIQMQLEARGAKVSGTVNHMLHAGAKIAREEMQAALKEYELRDTGDLIKSIKASKIKKGDSGKYITIVLNFIMREVFQEEMSKNGGNEGKWNVEEVETEE